VLNSEDRHAPPIKKKRDDEDEEEEEDLNDANYDEVRVEQNIYKTMCFYLLYFHFCKFSVCGKLLTRNVCYHNFRMHVDSQIHRTLFCGCCGM
jgi:hypothetical protein